MINISFEENAKGKQKEDIRLKRKMMTSTEKFYRKKEYYSHQAKESTKLK